MCVYGGRRVRCWQCVLRTVSAGKTHSGKKFWGCSNYTARDPGCGYFQLSEDAAGDEPAAAVASEAAAGETTVETPEPEKVELEHGPECECGAASVKLRVTREGPNKGRSFFRCAKGLSINNTLHEPSCDFFQWVDSGQATGFIGAEGPKCYCGTSTVQLRVTKSSPNVGRLFYRCRHG